MAGVDAALVAGDHRRLPIRPACRPVIPEAAFPGINLGDMRVRRVGFIVLFGDGNCEPLTIYLTNPMCRF
jgi:hypothetical protein